MNKLQAVRGTKDYIGAGAAQLHWLVEKARAVAEQYHYQEIITPLIESVDVFTRSLGQHSDIVYKEMFVFDDRGGDKICLRPENTAGVMRAFINNGLQQHLPLKLFYHGPMFRYERPQKGRYRQFHQFGAEYLTADNSAAATIDAEVIHFAYRLLTQLNLQAPWRLEINSLGSAVSRARYRDRLVTYFSKYQQDLSPDSQTRLRENPLRILDSKDEGDRKIIATAPTIAADYDQASQQQWEGLLEQLAAINIPYHHQPTLVRGLDYYCHTTFEFTTAALGAQGTILAGGRYDGLVKLLGGGDVAGVGFAAGLERLVELLPNSHALSSRLLFLCPIGDEALRQTLPLASRWRDAGLDIDFINNGHIKKSLARANKAMARVAIIYGDEELAQNKFQWKDLQSGEQKLLSFDEVSDNASSLSC